MASLAAIESLPYTSSMMGDIAVVPPHGDMLPHTSSGEVTAKVGANFGKIGKMVKHPGQKVNWNNVTTRGRVRMEQRGVTQGMVDDWVESGKVLKQSSGNHIYITREGVAVLNNADELVATYSKADFDVNMLNIINQLFGE